MDDLGFALLFPNAGIELPSLWEAASDRPLSEVDDWGSPDIHRVWSWKDELPVHGLAWYGRFLRGRASFLAPRLLHDLYPRTGEADDFLDAPFGPDARRIAEVLLVEGPTSKVALREAVGADGRKGVARFERALTELSKALVVTQFGTEPQSAGWPSTVLELTARAFDIPQANDGESARDRVASAFLDTMVAARAIDLARTFGWRAAAARAVLEAAVDRGDAVVEDGDYRLATKGGRS